jgi:hypothetical protein
MATIHNEEHTKWLEDMRQFCVELGIYLKSERLIAFPPSIPANEEGMFDYLCDMSIGCTYICNIDVQAHSVIIFDIQSMARELIKVIGSHPAMPFVVEGRTTPFFENTLMMALALGVEHQDTMKTISNNVNITHLRPTATIYS